MTSLVVDDSPKMLRETLSVAQSGIAALIRKGYTHAGASMDSHMARLQRLIDECERHRPTGSDGKHGDRHTATCGCSSVGDTAAQIQHRLDVVKRRLAFVDTTGWADAEELRDDIEWLHETLQRDHPLPVVVRGER